MNCVIPGLNVKVIAKALQALCKVGDELYVEIRKEQLSFVVINLSKTVCVRYHYLDSFFSTYEVDEDELALQNNETLTCKIHMKLVLPLFKGTLEKKLDFIKLVYENNSDVLIFKMKYKLDDIIMTHKLHLMESESLTIGISSDSGSNNVCASSSFYSQLLSMFGSSDDEITLEITENKVIARNYYIGATYKPKSVRSQVTLNASEFDVFRITKETSINFSLKPFRTAVHFAEAFNLSVGFNFDTGGKPLTVIMKNPTFEVNFIVATLDPYADMQTTMSSMPIPTKVTVNNENKNNVTVEDRQVLENINWEENIDSEPTSKSSSSRKSTFGELMNKVKQKRRSLKENVVNGEEGDKVAPSTRTTTANSSPVLNRNRDLDLDTSPVLNLTKSLDPQPVDDDFIPRSPESPRTKKARTVFGRCFDPTFHATILGQVLAENSDSD